MSAPWIKLADLTKGIGWGNTVSLSNNELVLLTSKNAFKYNHTSNSWKLWIKYDNKLFQSTVPCFDKLTQKIYLYVSHHGHMIVIDTR